MLIFENLLTSHYAGGKRCGDCFKKVEKYFCHLFQITPFAE